MELFCQQCGEDLTKLDCGFDDDINPKRGKERRDRDDEEEWGRIPIPQSDDESEGDTWLDESDDSDQEHNLRSACVVSVKTMFNKEPNITMKNRINKPVTDDFVFRHGKRRDGNILRKDGTILTLYELNPLKVIETNPIGEIQLPDEVPRRPRWTSALMTFQRLQLIKDGILKQNKIKGENHEADKNESEQDHEITKRTNRQTTTSLKAPIHTNNLKLHKPS